MLYSKMGYYLQEESEGLGTEYRKDMCLALLKVLSCKVEVKSWRERTYEGVLEGFWQHIRYKDQPVNKIGHHHSRGSNLHCK